MDSSTREFEIAARRCLDAVCARDEATYVEFLSDNVPFHAILPMGTFTDADAYRKAQKSHWFGVATGSFSYTIERIETSGSLGFLLLRAVYANVDAEGPFRKEILISNLFRKVGDRWFLSFNQNTVISTTR